MGLRLEWNLCRGCAEERHDVLAGRHSQMRLNGLCGVCRAVINQERRTARPSRAEPRHRFEGYRAPGSGYSKEMERARADRELLRRIGW